MVQRALLGFLLWGLIFQGVLGGSIDNSIDLNFIYHNSPPTLATQELVPGSSTHFLAVEAGGKIWPTTTPQVVVLTDDGDLESCSVRHSNGTGLMIEDVAPINQAFRNITAHSYSVWRFTLPASASQTTIHYRIICVDTNQTVVLKTTSQTVNPLGQAYIADPVPSANDYSYTVGDHCGDGIKTGLEKCDGGTGCDATTCVCNTPGYYEGSGIHCVTQCGDNIKAGTEDCDNTTSPSCVSCTCSATNGYYPGSGVNCVTTCSDGKRAGTEECDGGTGCTGSCLCNGTAGYHPASSNGVHCVTTCGDGVRAGTEQCDANSAGCSSCV